jgi:hypothetical protein
MAAAAAAEAPAGALEGVKLENQGGGEGREGAERLLGVEDVCVGRVVVRRVVVDDGLPTPHAAAAAEAMMALADSMGSGGEGAADGEPMG